jgi:uncharacterized protein (DUF2267 family)
MAHTTIDDFLREVAREIGVPSAPNRGVQSIVEATLCALATVLPTIDLLPLATSLPEELRRVITAREGRDSFFDCVARNEHADVERATEHAECVLRVLGRTLDDEILTRLKKHLPAHVAAHLEQPPISPPSTNADARSRGYGAAIRAPA